MIEGPRKWKKEAGCQRQKGSCDEESRGLSDVTVIFEDGSQPGAWSAGGLWELETAGKQVAP